MAIVRFNNRKNSTSKRNTNKLKRIIDYITDPDKTCDTLIGGNSINKENALTRMNIVKNYYNKIGGREYIHFSVSFKGQQDYFIVYDIGQRISELYNDYQVLFSVHVDTRNTHIHFVINTVSVLDGHKFSQSKADLQQLKECIDKIIHLSGLPSDAKIEYNVVYDSNDETEDEIEDEDNIELIEPMFFYNQYGLIEPMIFYDDTVYEEETNNEV